MESDRKKISGKPRLLIILNRFVIGGQAADTIPLAWYLKKDFEILIIYGKKEKDEIEPSFLLERHPEISLKQIRYLKRSINPVIDILAFLCILIEILKFKANIVHTHGSKPGFLGRIAAWVLHVPVIIHTFHGHFFHSYFSSRISHIIIFIERAIGKITTCAVALSTSQKDELVSKYKILPQSKLKVIPLGFAFKTNTEPATERETFRRRYHLQKDDVAIGIVGRIVPIKNLSFFAKIIQQILANHQEEAPAFFIIGDGELRLQIEEELREKHVEFGKSVNASIRVVFTSWLTNVDEIMNGLDIIVLTSINEGTPLSIIEAQFFGKPVVATNVGGVRDSMKDGATGFLIESNDLSAFCNKLQLLINSQELRNKLGEEGRKFVAEKFSRQKEVLEMKQLYLSLLVRKGY